MRRSEFQRLARIRVADASALLRMRRYAACYYLAGYAVECALKACIAKKFRRHDIPEPKLVNSTYTHKLGNLLDIAGLQGALQTVDDEELLTNWGIVKDWVPERRCRAKVTRNEARDLYEAVSDPEHGVMPWLQRHW